MLPSAGPGLAAGARTRPTSAPSTNTADADPDASVASANLDAMRKKVALFDIATPQVLTLLSAKSIARASRRGLSRRPLLARATFPARFPHAISRVRRWRVRASEHPVRPVSVAPSRPRRQESDVGVRIPSRTLLAWAASNLPCPRH